MPVITAFTDHPTRPYVRVEINWADTPSVEYARVLRVNPATGECVPLRPYVCYNGDYILLSCGHGVFWDTEAPLDTPFYYLTEGLDVPCIPAAAVISDTFTRTELTDWGETDTGETWTQTLAAGTTASVSGGRGRITVDSVDETVFESIPVPLVNYSGSIQFFTTEIATGNVLVFELDLRQQDANNYYFLHILPNTDTSIVGRIGSTLGGVSTFDQVTSGIYAINSAINTQWEIAGPTIRFKWWAEGQSTPADWLIERTEATIATAGNFRVRMGTSAGNTNAPVELYTDNLSISELCVPCTPVTVDTSLSPTTVTSGGSFWLKDPVRPCNDRPVPLCAAGGSVTESCGGEGGITFVDIGAELYAPNSLSLRPTNRRRPIAVTRTRADASTVLRLQTLAFNDRDDLIALAAPGSPLLFQGPAEYGVPDRYMDVKTVQIERGVSDHRIPLRTAALPYETVDRPAGPSLGICGTRVQDICEQHPTWQSLQDAGFTWDDLLRGSANSVSANPDARTWNDVNAEFADWNAVNTGGRTWAGLQVGD